MSRGWMIPILAAALGLAGCQKTEPISKYKAPRVERKAERDPRPGPLKAGPLKREPARLLGAIAPHEDTLWFIRLNGPERIVTKLEDEFQSFVKSIRFPGGKEPIAWDLPKGWQQKPGDGAFRYATLMTPTDPPQEVIVSPQARKKNEALLKENLDRWRENFLNGPKLEPGEMDRLTRTIDVNGVKVVLVDMVGTTAGGKGPLPPGHPPVAAMPKLPFDVELPKGWKQAGGKGDSGALGFGETLVFFNRTMETPNWPHVIEGISRKLGLGEAPADKVRAATDSLDIKGRKASMVEFSFPESERPSGLVGVHIPDGESGWMFLMLSPAADLESSKAELLSFLRAVRF